VLQREMQVVVPAQRLLQQAGYLFALFVRHTGHCELSHQELL
jgi:hypothetical protein